VVFFLNLDTLKGQGQMGFNFENSQQEIIILDLVLTPIFQIN
jgi:hypothetical protein